MGQHRIVPICVALVLVAAVTAASAEPVGRDGNHGVHGSVSTTTPAGGTNTVTSGNVPKDTDLISILVGDEAGDTALFKSMTFSLMQFKTPGKRTVACAVLAGRTLKKMRDLAVGTDLSPEAFESLAQTVALAHAALCLRIARLMADIESEAPARAGRAAARSCDVVPISVAVRTERTEDGGYRVVPTGKLTDRAKPLPAKITCKGKDGKLKIAIKAKKGTDLSKGLQKSVKFGIVSPSDATSDAHIKVGFKG
ncbi:hypothetical protein [Nocardioides aquiterrae]|uniref:Uncharacterized protein n=1 Tax=Nocardioides aquiterrae TaxID=203799 RepID=A0ABN1UBE3_9ACTN